MRKLILPVLLSCAWAGSAADLFRVTGTVVNAETGAPLARALVATMKVGTTVIVARQTTGEDGRFAFQLPQGSYVLNAGPRYALEQYGRRRPDALLGTSIITGPDQNTTDLTFRWYPTGGISGKVVDEAGQPVENALVQLVRSTIATGHRVTNTLGWARSDDRGEYRFGRLFAGTYYLVVTGKPWYVEDQEHGQATTAYRTVYYPNSVDVGGAAPVALKSGEERRADFTVQPVPGGSLTVTYENPQGLRGTISLLSPGVGGSDGFERSETLVGHNQRLTGIPPGRYVLRMTGTRGKTPVSAFRTVDVAGGDQEVQIDPIANPQITGTLRMKNGEVKPRGTILVTVVNAATLGTVSTQYNRTGASCLRRSCRGSTARLSAASTDFSRRRSGWKERSSTMARWS